MSTATLSRTAAGPSGSSNAGISALTSASITTSEQLVKALRIPQVPANGLAKIDIALEAWHSTSFFIPKKAELLSQWVLEHLCSSLRTSSSASAPSTPNKGKTKSKQRQEMPSNGSPELDVKTWELLSAIVTAQINADSDLSEAAKRSWLSHLANTQPVLALAGAFARQLTQAESLSLEYREILMSSASVSLTKLLPPSTSRTAATNIEAATDAIQAWLDFFGSPRSTIEQQTGHVILRSIVATWTTTLQYGSNAKRNHQHFCNTAVPSHLRALHTLSTQNSEFKSTSAETLQLLDVVKQVAAESLFTEDVQRSLLQAGRNAQVTRSASWKETKAATSGVVEQVAGPLQDQHLTEEALSALATLSSLLYAKLHRSEALNSIASSSTTSSGSVRETQLSLVRRTMLSEWYFPLLPFLVTLAGDKDRRAQRAAARRGLLQGIEHNSIFVMGCDEQEEWRSLFSTLFVSARDDLREVAIDATPTAQNEIADHFACLTSLWRLEKSVVEDDLISIFAIVAAQRVSKKALWMSEELPTSTLAALDFFRAVATIDVRFRTIPTLVHAVLSSIPLAGERVAQTADNSLSSSLFTSHTFLVELGRLCRDSVTPMQVPDLIQRLTSLAQSLDSVLDSNAIPKSKRQHTIPNSQIKSNNPAEGAFALIVQLRIAAQVVQSVNLASALRARSLAAAEEVHNTLVLPCLEPCLASTRRHLPPITYGVAAAALRVRQALLSEKWRYDPSEPVKLDGSFPAESVSCLEVAFDERADSLIELLLLNEANSQGSNSELYQLQFQILQSLLQRAERDTFLEMMDSRYCQLISRDDGAVFKFLKEHLAPAVARPRASTRAWCGSPNRIRDRSELMQVVLMAVVTRWALLFENLAANATLDLLATALVSSAETSLKDTDAESATRYITSTAFRNASFLELPKWRKHIISVIQEKLSNGESLERGLAAIAPLWTTPSEWVNRSIRGSLLVKLLALDRDVAAVQQGKAADKVLIANWTELRRLLARVQEDYAIESEVSEDSLFVSLETLLLSQSSDASESDLCRSWERASLDAIQSTVRVLLARGKQNATTQARLVQVAKQTRQETLAEKSKNKSRITLKMRAAQDMLATVGEAAQQTDVGAATKNLDAVMRLASTKNDTLSDVTQTLDLLLYHLREVRLLIHGARADDAVYQSLLLTLTKDVVSAICVIFSRGQVVLQRDLSKGSAQQTLIRTATNVALELVRCIDTCSGTVSNAQSGRASALAVCLAYSALIASLPGLLEQRRVADGLERIVSHLESERYNHLVSQLLVALRTTTAASRVETVDAVEAAAIDGDEAALISTIGLVLGSAPEGTSKIARSHVSDWLAILMTSNATAHGGRIRLRSMVASVSALGLLCSHHAMLFRTQDMGAILQLFSTVTGPSMSDDPSPSVVELPRAHLDGMRTKLFDGIVSTLGSLMRLRQDLVLSFLPHLGSLLARLCTLFRRLRGSGASRIEASGLQRRQLRRDLPVWLDPVLVTPLGADHEARALSRLLSALIVKNVSLKNRSSDATSGTAKAESLAGAFSKHATFILVAYLRSLTALHSVVPADVRAELEVGMLTVCGIIGHRQRDAAMIGLLDSAGKILFKRIWGEYEKQRYKGQ